MNPRARIGFLLALVLVGAAPGSAAAACRAPLTQRMDGRISGCLRIGALHAGPHTVVILQVPNVPALPPPAGKRLPRPTPPPREPRVRVSLSPASGAPGTVVTITGYTTRRLPRHTLYPNACWDGCALGLQYGGEGARRISPHRFRVRIVIPAAPWIEGDPVRVAPLVSGAYPIGLDCVLSARACAGREEGRATFHLIVSHPLGWCRTPASCARLRVTPRRGQPADLVRITGYAPLVSITGANQPFVFETEVKRGAPHGPQVVFGRGEVVFGHASLRVNAPPPFAALRDRAPVSQVPDALPLIAANPADPTTVAWCAEGAVDVGSTSIPTRAAATELTKLGYRFAAGQSPVCAAVAVLPRAGGAPAIAAAFAAAPAKYGGPPFYDIPLVTYDRGASWAPIPVPSGSTLSGFGGFRYRGEDLEAVFAAATPSHVPAYPVLDTNRPLAMLAGPDGSWRQVPLGCPPAGSCLELGPYLAGNCAMNGAEQPLLRSADNGVRWSPFTFPYPVNACGAGGLAATAHGDLLLIDSSSPYPLLRSRDGGLSWHDVALPRFRGRGGLTLLPGGSLLLSGDVGYARRWRLLRGGASRWCSVRTPAPALQRLPQASSATVIGGTLWWLTASETDFTQTTARSVPLAALSC